MVAAISDVRDGSFRVAPVLGKKRPTLPSHDIRSTPLLHVNVVSSRTLARATTLASRFYDDDDDANI